MWLRFEEQEGKWNNELKIAANESVVVSPSPHLHLDSLNSGTQRHYVSIKATPRAHLNAAILLGI